MAAIDDLIAEAQGQAEVSAVSGIDSLIAQEPEDITSPLAGHIERMVLGEPIEDWLPTDQAELAGDLFNSLDKPRDERDRMSSAILLADMFDADIDTMRIMQPAMMKAIYGDELERISKRFAKNPMEGGFFEKSIESLRRGDAAAVNDQAIYSAVFEGVGSEEDALAHRKRLQSFEEAVPIEGNKVSELFYASSRIVPAMARGYWDAVPTAFEGMLIGAGAGLVLGQLGPQVLTLADEPGLISKGAMTGTKIGFSVGSMVYWYKQGAGSMYANMIDKGHDPEIAKQVAGIAAIPYAIVEHSQVSKLIPGGRKNAEALAATVMIDVVKAAAIKYGKTWTQEVFEEVVQEMIAITAEKISGSLSDVTQQESVKEFILENSQRLWETTKGAAQAMALLPGPNVVLDIRSGRRSIVSQKRKAQINKQIDLFRQGVKIDLVKQGVAGKRADKILDLMVKGDTEAAQVEIDKINNDAMRRAFTSSVSKQAPTVTLPTVPEPATVAELEPTQPTKPVTPVESTIIAPKAAEAKPEAVEGKFKELIPPKFKGMFFNLNEETGKVAFLVPLDAEPGKKVDPRLQATPVKATVADLQQHFAKLDKPIQEAFAKWRNKFAKENPDKFNELINQPLTEEFLQPRDRIQPTPTAKPAEAAKPPTITSRQLLDERKAITSTPAQKRTPRQIKRLTEIEDELVLKHADEFPDIDITPKTRNAEIKKVQTQITQSGPYQAALDAVGDLPDLSGSFNVDSTEIGDIRARFEGRPDILKKFDLVETGGKRWDSQHDELGLPQDTTLDEFMDKIELFVDSNKAGKGAIHEAALAQALNDAQGSDAAFDIELFALKHDMLKNGFTAAEINKEVTRHAEENDVDLADLEADLIPLQEITDVGKKQQILRELDRTIKADKVKKVSDPEKIAIEKAGKIAARTKKPAFVREKDGKFTVTKLEPRKGDFIKITPAAPGKLEGKLERIKGKPKGPPPQTREAKLLIQRINIEQKKKGLTDKDFSDIKLQQGGSRRLTGTKPRTEEQLRAILKAIKRARPKIIGQKKVVKLKTERQIQSLKDNLTNAELMTDEAFDDILAKETGGKLPKYINSKAFITQQEGRNVINRMHDTAEKLRATESFARAIDADSEIALEHDKILEKDEFLGAKSPARLLAMRFFTQRMAERTGEPIYHVWQDLTFTHQVRLRERRKLLNSLEEMENFTVIARSEAALQRVSDFISSQSKLKNAPKSPENITPEEKAIAKRIQEIFKLYEFQARLGKFFEHKENLSQMPQYLRHKKAIDKALDIYDSEGLDPLIEYLKTQPWGIIKSGYEPTESVIRRVSTHRMPDIAIGKAHIKVRDIEYSKQDRNILQRLDSYMRQMDMMSFLQPKIKSLVRATDDVLEKFDEPQKVSAAISTYLDNLKRTNYEDGLVEEVLRKIYSQAITTLILADPIKPARNLLQNAAFAEDRQDFLNPDNKKLSPRDVEYMETFVHQDRVMLSDWAFAGEEPFDLPIIGQKRLGLTTLNKWIQRRTLYPASDRLNRTASFWAKTNRIKRAFSKNITLAEKMKEARFSDMQKPEQQLALGILARDGVDAMSRFVAKVHTDNTHFLYAREQRSPAEQTKLGKMVLNLALFKKAALEKATLQAQKAVKSEGTFEARKRAALVFVNLIVWSTLTSLLWKKITGKKFGAYDFVNFLEFESGGLMQAAVETITDVYNSMLRAAKGDSKALAALTVAIPRAADMFIPYYDLGLRAVEATLGTKNIDRVALRKVREAIDSEYKSRGIEKVNRDLVEKLQFVLAKSKPDEKKKKAQRIE